MDEWFSTPSILGSPSKKVAVNVVEGFRNSLLESETTSRKVPFKSLFTAILVHLGRVLFQIVVTISGFFPTLVILSHIGGFILERWLEILYTEGSFLRLKKVAVMFIQISILVSYCYFLVSFIYAPIFFVFVNFFSVIWMVQIFFFNNIQLIKYFLLLIIDRHFHKFSSKRNRIGLLYSQSMLCTLYSLYLYKFNIFV